VSALLSDVPVVSVAERLAQLAALEAAEPEPEPVAEGSGTDLRCMGETAAGEPCTMFRLKGSDCCYHHDPTRRAAAEGERAERARARDAARAERDAAREREAWACRSETPEQPAAFVAGVARAAWERRIDPEDARVCLEGAKLLAELPRPGPAGWAAPAAVRCAGGGASR
jgi:hypothetical protein